MGFFATSSPAIRRAAVTAVSGIMVLGLGVTSVIRGGGASNNTTLQSFQVLTKTSTGVVISIRQVGSLTSSGTLTLSGSVNALGGIFSNGSAAPSVANSNARYVLKQGDTMTGALVVKANISGSTLVIGGGNQIKHVYKGSATIDFANLAVASCEVTTMTVIGAVAGDPVFLGIPDASNVTNGQFTAWVSSAGTVSVKFCAVISGDPASGTFLASVVDF